MITVAMRAPAEASLLARRLVLPKLALTLIGVASLAGVWLTMTGHGAIAPAALVRWGHLVAVGILAGGAMWQALFVQSPEDAEHAPAVARFVRAERRRFAPLATGAGALALVTLPHLAWLWRGSGGAARTFLAVGAAATALGLACTAATVTERDAGDAAFRCRRPWAALAFLTLALVLTAIVDARLTFPDSIAASVLRPLHVAAFALWLGGAAWNIFIAIPAARETLAVPTVVAAAQQLERFRATVRVLLPLLIVTGLAQALPYTGLDATALVGTLAGRVILLKLGLVVGLVTIFVTCPLWRGCSPIRGMCDLEELDAGALPEPTRRLDNRGRACAGFVHVRRVLATLRPGETLELLSSDRISWEELPGWLARRGYVLLRRDRWGSLWWRSYRYLICKRDVASAPAREPSHADGGTDDDAVPQVPEGLQARA